jgi:putative oligomerization/nucleic acid binding protein
MPFRRRRPLLRAAAVGGGAYMAGKHRANSQAQEAEAEQSAAPAEAAPPAAPAPAGGMSPDAIAQLKDLADLHTQGVLTDEEFADQKAKLLAG